MSREIKFRAWHKAWRKMFDIDCTHYIDAPEYGEPIAWDNPDFEFMQFTGLYDKTAWEELTEKERTDFVRGGHMPSEWKGREIYEGDIVVWSCFDGERYRVIYDRWGIPALAGVFNCEAYDFKELEMCHNATSNKCEVIGNIYEHSHLLDNLEMK